MRRLVAACLLADARSLFLPSVRPVREGSGGNGTLPNMGYGSPLSAHKSKACSQIQG